MIVAIAYTFPCTWPQNDYETQRKPSMWMKNARLMDGNAPLRLEPRLSHAYQQHAARSLLMATLLLREIQYLHEFSVRRTSDPPADSVPS